MEIAFHIIDKLLQFFFLFQNLSQLLESRPLPILAKTKKAIWRNLLSIQNEAISLIAMRSKDLWLVHKNHATVKFDSNGFSWNENLQRNLQILKKMLEKSNQFFSSEQPCEPKSLDVALNIARVERIRSENLLLRSTLDAIWFEFWMKGALPTVEICVLCGWWFSNQINIVIAAIQLAVSCGELYFSRCCALKRTGAFASASKVTCLF